MITATPAAVAAEPPEVVGCTFGDAEAPTELSRVEDLKKLGFDVADIEAYEQTNSVFDSAVDSEMRDADRCPLDHYDIGYDEGAINNVGRKAYGLITQGAFGIAKWIVGIAAAMIRWAFGFSIADALTAPIQKLYQAFDDRVAGPLKLTYFALFITGIVAAWYLLRGRMSSAFGELGLSFLILLMLTQFVISDPMTFVKGGLTEASNLAAGIAYTACTNSGDDGSNADCPKPEREGCVNNNARHFADCGRYKLSDDAVAAPLVSKLEEVLVVDSYDLINWGEVIDSDHPCYARKEAIIATGPWGASDAPRDYMKASDDPACRKLAAFNHDSSIDRTMGAVFLIPIAGLVAILLALIAVTIIVAQAIAVVLIAALPFVIPLGLMPKRSRSGLWRFVGLLLAAFLSVVAMAALLAGLLLVLDALNSNDALGGRSLFIRSLGFFVVVLAAFLMRKRILAGFQSFGKNMAQKLSAVTPGSWGSSGGIGPSQAALAGGISGFGMANLARENSAEVASATQPAKNAFKKNLTSTGRHGQGAADLKRAIGDQGATPGSATGAGPSAKGTKGRAGAIRNSRVGRELGNSRVGSAGKVAGRGAKVAGRGAKVAAKTAGKGVMLVPGIGTGVAVVGGKLAGKAAAKKAATKAKAATTKRQMHAPVEAGKRRLDSRRKQYAATKRQAKTSSPLRNAQKRKTKERSNGPR